MGGDGADGDDGDVGDVGGGAGEVHPAVHHHFQLLWSSEGN